MITIGAVLDDPTCMRHVPCEVGQTAVRNPAPLATTCVDNSAVTSEKARLHVLVVDDEPLIRWSVAESLTDLGLDVEQAGDAASTLRVVTTSRRPFQVVVLDFRLPDMRDLSLLATLRQLLPEARLILMTAFGTPDITTDANLLGAAVVNKPFDLDDMARLVLGIPRGGSK